MTLTLNKLEKVMELEEQLRSQYQGQLDEKAAKIEELTKKQDELQATIDSHQATIDKNTVRAEGGAFRSRRKWYELSYKCTASADNMKVLSFEYKIGPEIPQSKWTAYSLWE